MADEVASNDIRFDGLYSHPECERYDSIYYLRFYPDGDVIYVSSSGSPHDLKNWFNKDHGTVSKGSFEHDGEKIEFSVAGFGKRSNFIGEIDGLSIKVHKSGKSQRPEDQVYTFVSWDSKRRCDNWEDHKENNGSDAKSDEVSEAVLTDKELLNLLEKGGKLSISYFGGNTVELHECDLPVEEALPALKSFLALNTDHRQADARHLFAYCNETILAVGEDVIEDMGGVKPTLDQIWDHVKVRHIFFGKLDVGKYVSTPTVYLQIEADVSWEPEHGLQMSWADGNQLVKVGPFNGPPTNGHAKADPSFDKFVFYSSFAELCTLPDNV